MAYLHRAPPIPLGRLPREFTVLPESLLANRGKAPNSNVEANSDLLLQLRQLLTARASMSATSGFVKFSFFAI